MHDLDTTLGGEFEGEFDSFEFDMQELEGFELETGDIFGEMEEEAPFDEIEEMELASQLLSVSDEAELDQFLGSLIRKAGRAAGRFIKSPTGRALGGILRAAAKKALPVVGGALGTAFGGPAGGMLGSRLASGAGRLFGLELEGLSPEDQEFEVARQFVRFAGTAAKNAALAPATASPQAAAKAAAIAAAQRHAPGLVRAGGLSSRYGMGGTGRSGRWVRRGRRIILLGVS